MNRYRPYWEWLALRKEVRERVGRWLRVAEWLTRGHEDFSGIQDWEVERACVLLEHGWTMEEISDWTGRNYKSLLKRVEQQNEMEVGKCYFQQQKKLQTD